MVMTIYFFPSPSIPQVLFVQLYPCLTVHTNRKTRHIHNKCQMASFFILSIFKNVLKLSNMNIEILKEYAMSWKLILQRREFFKFTGEGEKVPMAMHRPITTFSFKHKIYQNISIVGADLELWVIKHVSIKHF